MFLRNKTLVIVIFYLLLAVSISAQTICKISGTINDAKQPDVQFLADELMLGYKPEITKLPLKSGAFAFQPQLTHNKFFQMRYGNLSMALYVEPGDELQVSFSDEKDIRNISLSGKGAEQNAFFTKFIDQFRNDYNDSMMQSKMLTMSIDAFEIEIFNNRKKQNDYLKNDAARTAFSADFNLFMQNLITYRYWNLLFAHPIVNANSSNQVMTVNELPAVMLDGFAQVQLNNNAALICDSYRDFLKYYIIYFTSKANGFKKFNDFSISTDRKLAIAKDQLKDEVFTWWLAKFTTEECSRISPFMAKKLTSTLAENDLKKKYVATVNEVCGKQLTAANDSKTGKKETKSEKPSSNDDEIDLVDVNGKSVSLSDFKGKVVYIDFWASWCGPCRMMMPYSKQLHEQLNDEQKKKIAFLYISIDASTDAWKKGITDNNIEGTNLISPGNWSSKVCQYFQIYSIPRYMIMNKKGDIVDFNAKRPADPAVLSDLLKLVD